jgi:hypothetical protein
MDRWEWIKTMPSRRRKQLIRAAKALEERGELSHKFRFIKAFVKTEKLPYFGVRGDVYGVEFAEYVARLIQAPHDETHLLAGPWLKPLCHYLKQDWSWDNWLFYASVAPEDLDRWLNRNKSALSWFWADYSSFDSTYSSSAWLMIERLYSAIYPDAPLGFWAALDAWRQPEGRISLSKDEAVIWYLASIMNASGRDDTALANALVNGMCLALAFAAALARVSVFQLKAEHLSAVADMTSIAVVGDDSLVACSFDVTLLQDAIIGNLKAFGLVVKAESSYELADVTFLGMMPYQVGSDMIWGPTLGRRLYKAFWQEDPVGNLPAWTLGVAKQLSLFRHVPLLVEMADQVISLLPGGKVTAFKADANRIWASRSAETRAYGPETLDWLCHRYRARGLTPSMIRSDVATITGISRLPAMVRLHTMEAALVCDDL